MKTQTTTMKKIFLLLASAGLLLATTMRATESTATLEITGMTCDKCAISVSQALRQIEGVKSADVNLAEERATVRYDSAKTGRNQLIAAITQAGGKGHTFKVAEAAPASSQSCESGCGTSGGCCGAPAVKGGK